MERREVIVNVAYGGRVFYRCTDCRWGISASVKEEQIANLTVFDAHRCEDYPKGLAQIQPT
jgi:hypothetical protein